MALRIADNLSYQGKLPNFTRDTFKTLEEMRSYPDTSIDEGHVSLCLEDEKRYQFFSTNPEDPTTGKWRPTIDSALDTTSENPLQNKVVAEELKKLQKEAEELYSRLIEIVEEVGFFIASIGTNLNERINENESSIAAALNDLERRKLDSSVTINGYEIGSGLELTKEDVGLGNVDNTSDLDKPISRSVQGEFNKINIALEEIIRIISPGNE